MTSSGVRALADALSEESERAGAAAPGVRRADWRMAVVATVDASGTITTTDGIVAKRLQSYRRPAVSDVVIISQSGAGSWLALGRLEATNDTWTNISLAAGWTAQANYYVPGYKLNSDGTASLCGMSSMSGSLASGATVATLPAEARPASQVRYTVQVAIGYFGVMTLTPGGPVTLGDYNPALPGTGTKYAQFDVASHYRLA